MTEPAIETEQGQQEQEQGSGYTPPATQAELDRIIAERVARTKNQFKDYADLKAAKAELDQIKQANQTEAERLAAERDQSRAESQTWQTVALNSRIESLAGDFADPTDALGALGDDLAKYLNGNVIDEAAIKADLSTVLEKKPHWRRQSETPRLPWPNSAQGAGGAPPTNPADHMNALIRNARSGQ